MTSRSFGPAPTRPFALFGALLLVVVVAACGGIASPSPSADASQPASPSQATDPSAPGDSIEPSDGQSAVDLSRSADALAGLDSYVVSVEMKGLMPSSEADGTITMTSTVVHEPEEAAKFTMSGVQGTTGQGLTVIVIDDESWIDAGGGTFIKNPGGADQFTSMFVALSPATLVQNFTGIGAGVEKVGDESKNGVQTEHFRLDAATNPTAAAAAGMTDGSVDIWLAADGGYLISMVFAGIYAVQGTDTDLTMSIDVTNINDPANVIERPA